MGVTDYTDLQRRAREALERAENSLKYWHTFGGLASKKLDAEEQRDFARAVLDLVEENRELRAEVNSYRALLIEEALEEDV